ncbi:MAG: AAA family ATPase [Isosphaeraceae bacterium]
MATRRLLLWVMGPTGSGKSTLLAGGLPRGFRVLDQDAELERAMNARGLPLDLRTHDLAQAAAFSTLRQEVAERVWGRLPGWLASGDPVAIETTGDKPHLLRAEVELAAASGYRSVGLGLRCDLATCLRRNRSRRRVLPDDVVEGSWASFEANLSGGVYPAVFGPGGWIVVTEPQDFDLARWMSDLAPRPSGP